MKTNTMYFSCFHVTLLCFRLLLRNLNPAKSAVRFCCAFARHYEKLQKTVSTPKTAEVFKIILHKKLILCEIFAK